MERKYWHAIGAAVFIILSFFVLPELLPKVALHFSPGGLRMPDAPFLNVGLLAALMLIAVFVKNFDNLGKVRGPRVWEVIVFGLLSAVNFGWFTGLLFAITPNLFVHLVLAGFAYGLGLLFLLLALFGLEVFKQLWKDMSMVASALIFYTGITLFVDSTRFHVLTAKLTKYVLSPFFNVLMNEVQFQPWMSVDGFSVIIGPPCSGVFSMVLFTALFSFVYWLDREKINGRQAIKLYIIGVLGAYLINLLRVVVLLVIGAKWSPKIAVGLFHTNAGWILFAVYSFAYWWLAYPHLVKKH
ncbi:MAG TPA: archaeosortase/exosortase family protein [Candidatus Nanoarchaeia archaeon]|nr:archaeosortase/exosortase family protein [Candidatus Nanoarchaeia archaeon]